MGRPNTKAIAQSIANLLASVSIPAGVLTTCSQSITGSSSPQTVTPASMPAAIVAGATLAIDLGPTQEAVFVISTTSTTFTAVFLQNHAPTWQIATPVYSLIKIGEMQDPTDVATYASIVFMRRKTERLTGGTGWRVNSKPIFAIESGFDTTGADMTVVENTLMDVADQLTGLFVEHFQIGNASGVYTNLVEDADDEGAFREFPNGRTYRVHECYIQPVQQYNVTPTS
jgi:hypothetical protein